eukprot:CAMPEP_0201531654 /NCGR_PEP_ID=MMETSP0161_2-20130828/48236_1 /ASSEMBLY_ACC=CAM_ASM_000251 /TAXON_ID=180227 /ORGANISM="Neoparamoeba aestuarina, Strain SoJaBio B1-5/56/2" /LENGTH=203 /DNA_ID=CAMNT_0047934681 /DNA_START=55 /DNA_END=663 /DNA_ORIENTATION=-
MEAAAKGAQFCDELMQKFESGSIDSDTVKKMCQELTESTMPRFLPLSDGLLDDDNEKALHVPGIQVRREHTAKRSDEDDHEFSVIEKYTAVYDPETMVPKDDIEDALTYVGKRPIPMPGSQSPIEQIESVTRSSIKNMHSFAQRSKEFTKATQENSLEPLHSFVEAQTTITSQTANEMLSNFASSPDEFLSPYETTMVPPPSM